MLYYIYSTYIYIYVYTHMRSTQQKHKKSKRGLLLHSIASLGLGGTSPLIFDDASGQRSANFAGLTAELAQAESPRESV